MTTGGVDMDARVGGVGPTPVVEAVEHVPGVPRDVLVGDWMLALLQNREMNLPGGCSKEGEREGLGNK